MSTRTAMTTTLTTAGGSLSLSPEPSRPDLAAEPRGPLVTENETRTEPTQKHP